MSEDKKAAISEVLGGVLEDWAMCLVEPCEDVKSSLFEGETKLFSSKLSFKGPIDGSYIVVCGPSFMSVLAENILDGEDDTEEADKIDALGEFANVLCGNMLTEVYGEDPVFSLTPPEVTDLSKDDATNYFTNQTIGYLADDAPVAVTFLVDNE